MKGCIILQIALLVKLSFSFSLVSDVKFNPSRRTRQSTKIFSSASEGAKRVVVVSPPGGIGEVTAVQAAQRGSSVRWFVVTPQPSDSDATAVVSLSQETLDRIASAGGSLLFAGATIPTLLSTDESSSAIPAVSTWCGAADALVCTLDGAEDSGKKRRSDEVDPTIEWKDAIKVAAYEAAKLTKGMRIAVLSTSDADDMDSSSSDSKETDSGIFSKVGSLFGGNKASIPSTLTEAMKPSLNNDNGGTSNRLIKLRHGQIFGTPESSPDFSAFIGGPRRVPELCEEYRMRTIRVDPTLTVAGNMMMGKTTRSSRHAVGEAAALMLLEQVPIHPEGGLDICVSSQPGMDPFSENDWIKEFHRVETVLSSGEAAELFSADFASVPNVERLADWIASKWAPTVLRTYDIAAIRTGARPVIASRAGPGRTEIVWQQLVNFDSVTVGRMVIQVSDTGMKATRGPGDAAKGYGSISTKPLAGEDVLVRRLAEAASQAVEKGLANKLKAIVQTEAPKVVAVVPPVEAVPSPVGVATTPEISVRTSESGPRVAGARRSTERIRKKSAAPAPDSTPVQEEE